MLNSIANRHHDQQLDFFAENLPIRPRCSDDFELTGSYVLPIEQAIGKRYIQYNPPKKIHWLAYDIDRAFGRLEDEIFGENGFYLAKPNLIVRSPLSEKVHILYGIETGVTVSAAGRMAPQKYLAAVDEGIRHSLQGDLAFQKHMCKNPLSEFWKTEVVRKQLYQLGELAEFIDLDAATKRLRERPLRQHTGIGRNCSLFDNLRFWAYREFHKYKDKSLERWKVDVAAKAESMNNFKTPLPLNEVFSVAKSVATWVWKHYDGTSSRSMSAADLADLGLTPETFSMLQSNLGKIGLQKRWGNNDDKKPEAVRMRRSGMTVRDIAKELGVGKSTVDRWLK